MTEIGTKRHRSIFMYASGHIRRRSKDTLNQSVYQQLTKKTIYDKI